jgi:hypothetical protein
VSNVNAAIAMWEPLKVSKARSREQPRPVSMGVGNLATMAGGTQVRSFFLLCPIERQETTYQLIK